MATKLDLQLDQGATFEHLLTWTTNEGAPIDLTGYTARMQVRPKAGSDDLIFDLTTENGGITLGDVAGTITIAISATDSTAVIVRKGVYDLELCSSSGFITRLVQGKLVIDPEVTV